MAPSYTITSGDVASVDPSSRLTAGVEFDYGLQRITAPSSVSFIDAQWLVDHCRFVESTLMGAARKPIIDPYGKYVKGVDPLTSQPVLAGIEAILLDSWLIATAKTSGVFLVRDIFKADGSFPIFDNPAVEIRYQTSQGLSLVQLPGSGGGVTPAQVWSYSDRSLTDKSGFSLSPAGITAIWSFAAAGVATVGSAARYLTRLAKIHGLTGASVTASNTARTTSDGDVNQAITDNGDGSKTMSGSP